MGLVRMHSDSAVHFITNRCEQEQFLLLPKKETTQLVLKWLAKALCRHGQGIELYAFIFLSNHFHILLRDTRGKLAEFMCYFQANLAKAVNGELVRHGKFWSREYDDVIVDGENEFLDRYTYTLCNAVKAGLVDRARDWSGLCSLDHALTGEPYRVEVLNRTKLHNATRRGQKVDVGKFYETFELRLAAPPMWEGKTRKKTAALIEELVAGGEAHYRKLRDNKPALGMKRILAQRPTDRPLEPSFRPRIKIFSFNPARKKELLSIYRAFVGSYRESYHRFARAAALGKRPAIEWPHGSYPPSCWRPIGAEAA